MQRAISPAMAPSGSDRELGTGGVDNGHQRQAQILGQPHPLSRLAQGGRTQRGRPGLLVAVLADEDAGLAVEPGQGDQHGGVLLTLLGAVERQVPYRSRSRTPSRSVRRVCSTESHTGSADPPPPPRSGSAGGFGRSASTARVLSISAGRSSVATTASMTPLHCEVLGALHPSGKGRPRAPRRPSDPGTRQGHRALRRSRGPAIPTTRRRLRSSGAAGAPGRAAPQHGASSPRGRWPPSRRTRACPPASGCHRTRWSRAGAARRGLVLQPGTHRGPVLVERRWRLVDLDGLDPAVQVSGAARPARVRGRSRRT